MPRIEVVTTDEVRLRARLAIPDEPRGRGAVLLHPDPRHGGSMDVWMLPVLSRALERAGWHVLRFDLRGVRRSDGERGGVEDDLLDVAAAVDRVVDEAGDHAPLLLAGWSYGALLSLRYSVEDPRVDGWAGIAPPVGIEDLAPLRPDSDALGRWSRPKLVIHGTADGFTSKDEVARWFGEAAEPKRLRLIEGGDHFLADHGDELAREIASFAGEVAAQHRARSSG